ncbi:MAG: hypothetical protein M1376_22330 [Planctomycetes bacterium]|nr:hypothetical protein [Planctomycetota bacterium]
MTHSSCQQVQEQLLDMAGSSVPLEAGALRDHLDSCPACQAYWAALCADDALLRDCIDALQPAVARIEDGVLRQLAQVQQEGSIPPSQRPVSPTRGTARTHLLRLPLLWNRKTGLATAAVLALSLYLLFGRGRVTLYDQVMNALGRVQAVHLVDATLRDGRWEKETDLWYNREAGLAATQWQGGQMTVHRITNDGHAQVLADSGKVGRLGPSGRPLEVVADLLQTGLFTRDFIRVSREDKTVEGTPCRAYSLSNGTGTVRLLAWLDGAKRVRAWEKRRLLKDGDWETYRTGTIDYDVTPDPKLFQPDFTPGANLVDVDPAQ